MDETIIVSSQQQQQQQLPDDKQQLDQNDEYDMYENISYEDALDDIHTRFIVNLPLSELLTSDRIFVQLEQAWWYYEDFICDPRPHLSYLPRYTHFKPFAKELFQYSTILPNVNQFNSMWQEYSLYKRTISNYGCILLSSDYERIVLCQVYHGNTFLW